MHNRRGIFLFTIFFHILLNLNLNLIKIYRFIFFYLYLDKWFFSVFHRDIASMYFFFSIMMGFIGLFYSLIMRLSLSWSYSFITNGVIYLHYVTLHAVYMIFFFVMPFSIGGLSNLLIPLCFNLADMCLPRINNLSFWMLFFSFFLTVI